MLYNLSSCLSFHCGDIRAINCKSTFGIISSQRTVVNSVEASIEIGLKRVVPACNRGHELDPLFNFMTDEIFLAIGNRLHKRIGIAGIN